MRLRLGDYKILQPRRWPIPGQLLHLPMQVGKVREPDGEIYKNAWQYRRHSDQNDATANAEEERGPPPPIGFLRTVAGKIGQNRIQAQVKNTGGTRSTRRPQPACRSDRRGMTPSPCLGAAPTGSRC